MAASIRQRIEQSREYFKKFDEIGFSPLKATARYWVSKSVIGSKEAVQSAQDLSYALKQRHPESKAIINFCEDLVKKCEDLVLLSEHISFQEKTRLKYKAIKRAIEIDVERNKKYYQNHKKRG